ncbi:MAG: bifunctional phosphoglucose/phosphomannose isomerase [Caldiserica bacterium]|jgi:glucose/mannose-6-phosphate isomerase|nr:bifunctional phosphoglucose/phosphomannose isomerase [Caldisericota bacterium]MDH7562416.1 bifunctional phosphoglucose/phosphomannose isomerase [Caldisericota bacterium]
MALDNVSRIEALDPGGMLDTAFHLAEDIESASKLEFPSIPAFTVSKIFFSGTGGGSRSSFDLLRSFLLDRLPLPLYVHQGYDLPGFVDSQTLAIFMSHSGNTEEVLSCFNQALSRTKNIVVITGGGEAEKIALKEGLPLIKVPIGMEARSAIGFLFLSLLRLLSRIFPGIWNQEETGEVVENLKKERESLKKETPVFLNPAKKMALKLQGKIPLIYGFAGFSEGIALRFQRQLAENGKALSHANLLPDMHHDEIVGFQDPFYCQQSIGILIRDFFEPEKICLRFKVTRAIFGEKGIPFLEVFPGNRGSKLSRMFSLVQLLDFVSLYFGIVRGFNPKDVRIIGDIKDKMRTEL